MRIDDSHVIHVIAYPPFCFDRSVDTFSFFLLVPQQIANMIPNSSNAGRIATKGIRRNQQNNALPGMAAQKFGHQDFDQDALNNCFFKESVEQGRIHGYRSRVRVGRGHI